MKSRDHVNLLKEKLIFCMWKKLHEENKDFTVPPSISDKLSTTDQEGEGGDTTSTTPKSKSVQEPIQDKTEEVKFQLPPGNINYKYFIGKGNNSIMVRSLFKNRFWWVQHDKEEMERCNFCWTQIKKGNLMDVLSCKFPNKKSGIKNCNLSSLPAQLATP